MTKATPPFDCSYARVVRLDADGVTLSTGHGIRHVSPSTLPLSEGDLVSVENGRIQALIADNQSKRPLDEQDWWRLHRVLPNLRLRATIIQSIREWFNGQGFLELETPVITAHPGLEPHLRPIDVHVHDDVRQLITSPEYHMKRFLSSGEPRLYYLGKSFRDDERGAHHSNEFTMLEWYRAGEEPEQLMRDVEHLVSLATGQARTWQRISVREALERWGTPSNDPEKIVRQL